MHYEDKKLVQECVPYSEELPSFAIECHEIVSDLNHQHVSISKHASDVDYGIPVLNNESKHDWWSFHFNHIDEENAKNIDLYSTCSTREVDDVSSCDGNSDFCSLYAESRHDVDIKYGFKVFDKPLYDEVGNVD